MLKSPFGQRSAICALAAASAVVAPAAQAGVYISGNYSLQSTHLPYNVTESEYGSASVDVDLGRYIRLGYTYGVQYQKTQGYKDPTQADPSQTSTSGYCTKACGQTWNNTKTIENSLGLTVILYEGAVFMPFLLAGAVRKDMTIDIQDFNGSTLYHDVETIPGTIVPYGGGGIGIRLNRDFTLKFSYQVSPGVTEMPNMPAQRILDRQSSAGLTYQL